MNIEKEMHDHLKDFPKRRKELLEFQELTLKNDAEIINDVSAIKTQIKEGLTHPKPSAQTVAMVGEVKDLIIEHTKKSDILMRDYITWQEETNKAIHQLNELMPIVREKLLPAFEKDMSREEARKILRADFDSFSGWAKGWLLIVAVVTSFGVIIKVWLKP